MKKLFLLIFAVILLCSIQLSAAIWANRIPPLPEEKALNSASIISNVNHAGSSYFMGLMEINYYFAEVELDLTAGAEHLGIAKKHLNEAINLIQLTIDMVALTEEQKEQYKTFDYQDFLNNPRFHKQTVKKVVSYLSNADVRGFFNEMVKGYKETITAITKLEENVTKENLWNLFQLSTNRFGHIGTIITNDVFK
jgi:hypothetical protein